jgi:hypothetical protein
MKPGELVIYLDESGSADVFSSSGEDLLALGRTPNYLVIAALRCPDPNVVARCVASTIAWANTLPNRTRPPGIVTNLHAGKDDVRVRLRFCQELAALPIKATAIVMDKRLLDPTRTWRNDRRAFYDEMAARLLCDSLHLHEQTRIIFSRKNHETRVDLNVMVRAVEAEWATFMARVGAPLPKTVTARHEMAAKNPGLQAVDYVAWALFRAFERGDMTHYRILQPVIRHVVDVGRLTHYSSKHPMKNPP